ncbi:MAG: 50S ribosomal protein L23 [Succinivibrio sp.]|uniref:Large ribosomal subunit protein uL23 n=2 Tax=Succinivibrio TaxID=83770 RepID=A0ABS7DFA3_9GAMM|nr:50S ribosomal protein L23 [Succinivibrio sp.]MBQ2381640.1 50S ribosomal protein L23 [Succinivibrio sp.]MBW7569977.1 50S ribosomal protein L23 [Succinivibrio faecicola]MCI6938494.1 50S ribosomal protein L23 [Succinatimonas hippei]MDD6205538.1 50S ribosomal protein L23 [Succinivibrio sp.]
MMSQARLFDVLRAPVVSEKSTAANEKNVIVLKVAKDATKDEIKAAVKAVFNIDALAVRTLNFQGKVRRTARGFGKRSDWKKAYITVPENSLAEIEQAAQGNKESN